ncbi:MAG TPA: hypothetical protein VGN63_09960 [Flavisolibacter sp.]|jgi:hypothetical protein|nr:hypothetical protein [Flavisolibacter sp.]
MARIFTISYNYQGVTYNTMISVRTTPFYREYTLSNLDEHIQLQLPGNKIISPSPRQFLFPNAGTAHSNELMNTIINAVMMHLQTVDY